MRIIIDTEQEVIAVPNSYYTQMNRDNRLIVASGGTPINLKGFVKDAFEKAHKQEFVRQSDLTKKSRRVAKKSNSSGSTGDLPPLRTDA